LVQAAIAVLTEPHAIGHAFNIANPKPITQVELVELLAEACGKKPELIRIPRQFMLQSGGHPMGPKLYFAVYYDLPPITEVVTKAQRVLHFQPTDFLTGLKETYRWYLRHHERNPANYAFEDHLIANRPPMPV
jgi:nucleoside-diphosphate-sugar epimerase